MRPGSVIVLHDKASSGVIISGRISGICEREGYRFVIPEVYHARNNRCFLNNTFETLVDFTFLDCYQKQGRDFHGYRGRGNPRLQLVL